MMGTMSGKVIGSDLDTLDTLDLIASQLGSGEVTNWSDGVTVLFLGDELDYNTPGRDDLPPAISLPEGYNSAEQKNTFTTVGVTILVGLLVTLIGVIFVIVRRRRRVRALNAHQSLEDDGNSLDDIQQDAKGSRDLDGDIAVDENRNFAVNENSQDIVLPNDLTPPNPRDTCCDGYQFDLGGWMKSELIGVHGEDAIRASPSRGELPEENDSDNDSWAQTEATLGSLELRLDPNEAEV